MARTFYAHILTLTAFCLLSVLLYGQPEMNNSESLASLTDSLLKKEIASFSVKGNSIKQTDTLLKRKLRELPVSNCSDNEVHLSWSTFTSTVSTFINLYFKKDTLNKILDSIFLVTHSHFWVKIPGSAYKGLAQSNTFDFKKSRKKSEFYSPNYKAFYSADKKRLYIYMLGETASKKYEVTWVIVNDRYFTRIVDNL